MILVTDTLSVFKLVTDTLFVVKRDPHSMLAWIPIILTAVAAIAAAISAYYSWRSTRYNKKMADIMRSEHELMIAPIIVTDRIPSSRGKDIRSYQPVFTNKGLLPVKIKELVIEWWQKDSPYKTYKKSEIIDRILAVGESIRDGELKITITKDDIIKKHDKNQKDSDLNELLRSFQGRLYCTYSDIDIKEQKSRDLLFWETM